MKTSIQGLNLIKIFEGCKLKAYKCPADIWTIGYGHTKDVKSYDVITKDKSDELLKKDIIWVESVINKNVKAILNQNQFDALASFVFNVGENAFRSSTMLKYLNSSNEILQASKQFKVWNKVYDNKRGIYIESQGLTNRRKKEMELFLNNG
jgi:lysozyme